MKNCLSCTYSRYVDRINSDPNQSECHRYPPIATWIGNRYVRVWPIVENNDCCGEFELRSCLQDTPSPKERTKTAKERWGKVVGMDLGEKNE